MPKKKKVAETNSLSDWADVIHKMGEESRAKHAKEFAEQVAWMRNYFREDASRVEDLGETLLLSWNEGPFGEARPTINSRFSDKILGNERVLQDIWAEIVHRNQFDQLLKLSLER